MPGADHIGFGTLLFTRPATNGAAQLQNTPVSPGGVIAQGSAKGNELAWISSVGAKSYTIKRATNKDALKVIAANVTDTTYTDSRAKSGVVYRYIVYAANSFGESPGSLPVSVCAGLPPPWTHQDVGAVSAAGSANFDGNVFTLEGAGAGFGGTNDQFQFAFQPFNGDGPMVARFVPQTSSQFSQFGLMMRAAPTSNAACVALLISPVADRNVEAPGWEAQLAVRESLGAATTIRATSERFSEPMVTFGRLTGYCWLKLERVGNRFTAAFSSDGKTWKEVGSATIALQHKLLAGLGASSRSASITTTVWFDHVGAGNSAFTMNSSKHQIKSVAGLRAVKRSTNP